MGVSIILERAFIPFRLVRSKPIHVIDELMIAHSS